MAKTPLIRDGMKRPRRELPESTTIGADFYRPAQDINLPYKLVPRQGSVQETTDNKQ